MFPLQDTPPLARRLLGGLRLIRSFLLLEDDYDVDWEVDRDELEMDEIDPDRRETAWEEPWEDHPHRFALRSRLCSRRPGVPAPREQVCLCPLPRRVALHPDGGDPQRAANLTSGRDRSTIHR
jgi:hypothetical protein